MSDSSTAKHAAKDTLVIDGRAEVAPQRALPDEPATSGLAAFTDRVRRFALPGVVALSVLAGLGLAGITDSRPAASIAAAPAAVPIAPASGDPAPVDPAVIDEPRTGVDVTRSQDRPAIEDPADPSVEGDQPVLPPSDSPPSVVTKVMVTGPEVPANGTRYATETVNVRARASADSDKIGSLSQGDPVSVTSRTASGFSQVVLGGKNGWVATEFLSSTKPGTATSSASSSASASKSASARSGSSSAPLPSGGSSCKPVSGLQASTARVQQAICSRFPGAASSYGGVRPDSLDYRHPAGLALDVMISNSSSGWQIAEWARANAASFGISEVIYQQKIWTTQRGSEGWRSMSNRGSSTANHMDHVHISIG